MVTETFSATSPGVEVDFQAILGAVAKKKLLILQLKRRLLAGASVEAYLKQLLASAAWGVRCN